MQKKGIALLLTVSLVATIAALIGISAGIIDNSFKRISNKQFLIQSNSMLSGLIDILDENAADINDSASLDIFLSMPFVFDQKSKDISVNLVFESAASKLNINSMLQESNATAKKVPINPPIKPEYEAFLDRILTVYNVSDKISLLSLLADSIDSDAKERIAGSEIAYEDPFFTQGHIYSYAQLERILDEYKRQTLDFSVDNVPWRDIVSFENEEMDYNHISDAVKNGLGLQNGVDELSAMDESESALYESFKDLGVDKEREKELKALGVKFFSPLVKAYLNISSAQRHLKITFLYDLKMKEVSSIEITD